MDHASVDTRISTPPSGSRTTRGSWDVSCWVFITPERLQPAGRTFHDAETSFRARVGGRSIRPLRPCIIINSCGLPWSCFGERHVRREERNPCRTMETQTSWTGLDFDDSPQLRAAFFSLKSMIFCIFTDMKHRMVLGHLTTFGCPTTKGKEQIKYTSHPWHYFTCRLHLNKHSVL